MSVDAHELERAALQKKDREQLQAIATAMGRKPPSRSRKDQIIDLILELSGVVGDSGAAEAAPRRARAKSSEPDVPSLFAEDAGPGAPVLDGPPGGSTGVEPPSANGRGRTETDSPGVRATSPAVDDAAAAPTVSDTAPTASETAPPPSDSAPSLSETAPVASEAAPSARATVRSGRETTGRETSGRETTSGPTGPSTPTSGRPASPSRPAPPRTRRPEGPGGPEASTIASVARFVFDPLEGAGEDVPNLVGDGGRDHRGEADRDRDAADRDGQDHRENGDGPGRELGGQPGVDPGDGTSRRRRRRGKDRNRAEGAPLSGQPGTADRPTSPAPAPAPPPQAPSPQAAPPVTATPQHDGANTGTDQESVQVAGHLDLREEGYGFLRVRGYLPSKEDVYVPSKFVRQFGLRKGDHVAGVSRPAGRGEKNPALLRVDEINGRDPERSRARPRFEDLTPVFPEEKLRLEGEGATLTARLVDLVSPIGKGQRGLIVSPPKAGKTTVMKHVAQAIERNNPEVKLIVLLIDERPEEVTDMRRSVQGEVVASTFDRPAEEHTQVVELTLERAKRMVEAGEDVVIILDGITRLARAYNLAAPATGRVMSGGIDTGAMYLPKKFFGAARNVEEAGSLTIVATALVDTGSRMDEVIFEEFKGTANMELRLDRSLAERRVYPAVDVAGSSTRHEERLLGNEQLQQVWDLRRSLSDVENGASSAADLEALLERMKRSSSNAEFLAGLAGTPARDDDDRDDHFRSG